jgi:hypothetical protein
LLSSTPNSGVDGQIIIWAKKKKKTFVEATGDLVMILTKYERNKAGKNMDLPCAQCR